MCIKNILYLFLLLTLFSACEPTTNRSDNTDTPTIEEKDLKNLNVSPSAAEDAPTEPQPSTSLAPKKSPKGVLPYRLNVPEQVHKLPGRLTEISGLGISKYQNHLVTINDEKGDLYFVDKETGEVVNQLKFAKDGDYEGVEMVRDFVWVVRNDGTLFRIKNVNTDKQKTKEFPNKKLDKKYDVEGLGLDGINNRLLLACKGKAGKGDKYKNTRAVYAFDLDKKGFSKEPVFVISRSDIKKFIKSHRTESSLAENFIAFLDPEKDANDFAPSAIAIHPRSHQIYILSSVGKLLVILNEDGTIYHIEKLDAKVHRQPEGICFDENLTMYISNEGKGGKGRILMFPFLE